MSGHKKSRPIPPGAPGHPFTKDAPPRSGRAASRERGNFPIAKDEARARFPGPQPSREKAKARRRPLGQVEFLYEDDDIIAVDKPAGLSVISADGRRGRSLYDIVTEHIRKTNPKGRAAVVHRLDRDSSGVLVFAKNAKVKTLLMSRWSELARERKYAALVEGEPAADAGRLESWLVEAGPNRMRVAEAGERGALKAVTNYRVLARGAGFSLLELSLETGRKHQIRVQLAAAGHPIAGDERYGSMCDPAGRLCLHAISLVLKHPLSGRELRFESPVPPEFAAAVVPARRPPRPNARPLEGKP